MKSRVTGMNRSGLSEAIKMLSKQTIAPEADASIKIQFSMSALAT
jgi:hypothetical protein